MRGVLLMRMPLRFPSRAVHSSSNQNLEVFREINRLASEGKWDSINNKPELFVYGAAKRDAYATYNKFNTTTDIFERSAWGQYLKVAFRIALLFGVIKVGVVFYEFVIPEQQRLKYKYSQHGSSHHEEHH